MKNLEAKKLFKSLGRNVKYYRKLYVICFKKI